MKILSFDVGIKNLAYCYIDTNEPMTLLKWDIINLTDIKPICCYFDQCNKPIKYQINNIYSCKRHASKHETYFENCNHLSCSSLKKMKLNELRNTCESFAIKETKYKTHMVSAITKHVKDFAFKPYKKPNSNTMNLIEIGKNITTHCDSLFLDCQIDCIVIENQIGSIAARMKTIQGMLAQYFIIKKPDASIHFLSSHNKLKFFSTEKKLNYKERKQLSITKTLEHISEKHTTWIDFFQSHKKKDDLADCFLQCIIFLRLT